MKKRFIKLTKNITIITLILSNLIAVYCADYPTYEEGMAAAYIRQEMKAEGYSYEQICDEIDERVYGMDGLSGTGGRDGLLLDGSPAPNAPGNSGGQASAPAATPTPACNHNYTSEVVKEATCTESGKVTYTCTLCGKTYSENTAKTDHVFIVTEEVTGTCIETGYRVETCTGCGLEQTIDGLLGDHDLHEGANKEDPTCLEAGYTTEVCSICNEVFTTELPALGHEFETTYTVDITPTCTEEGLQSYHCVRCDESIEPMTLGALGHNYVTETTEPTVFKDGVEKCYCGRCMTVSYENPIPSLIDQHIVLIVAGIVLFGVALFFITVKVAGKNKK